MKMTNGSLLVICFAINSTQCILRAVNEFITARVSRVSRCADSKTQEFVITDPGEKTVPVSSLILPTVLAKVVRPTKGQEKVPYIYLRAGGSCSSAPVCVQFSAAVCLETSLW